MPIVMTIMTIMVFASVAISVSRAVAASVITVLVARTVAVSVVAATVTAVSGALMLSVPLAPTTRHGGPRSACGRRLVKD